MAVSLASSTHHLCVSWKDYLPLGKQVRLTNMVVPQDFNEKCGIQTGQKLEIYKGMVLWWVWDGISYPKQGSKAC